MAIEINGLPASQLRGSTQSNRTTSSQGSDSKSGSTTAGGVSDTVLLTDMAAKLKSIEESLASLPVVDMQRVNEVKQSIEDGSFELDPIQVAERVIEFEFSFGKN